MEDSRRRVGEYYKSVVDGYDGQYRAGFTGYPANQKRLELILARVRALKPGTLLDCGCGEGTPMAAFHEAGTSVWGFDFVGEMAERAKANLAGRGLADRVWKGDVMDPEAFSPPGTRAPERYDAMVATGVFPHIENETGALRNMARRLSDKGRVFIEFRNELFSLFTLNRYSYEFFRNKLIRLDELKKGHPEWAPELARLDEELKASFRMDFPPARKPAPGQLSFDEVLARFRNPDEVEPLFQEAGFKVEKIHYYHWHAFPTVFEAEHREIFRAASLSQEGHSDWRGKYMASAFIVEAVKQ